MVKDLYTTVFSDTQDLIRELRTKYYPECEIVSVSDYIKGHHKGEWFANIVFTYSDNYYLVDLDCVGNGGWLGVDEHKVCSIIKVKPRVVQEEKVVYYVV